MITDIKLQPSCTLLQAQLQGEAFQLRVWGNAAGARGVALLVHGLGAHSAWFEAAARELIQRNFLVIAYDQRGFGSRRHIHLNSYKEWLADLVAVSKYVRSQYELPFYLMGNSMGALVVMAANSMIKPDAVVIFSPGFDGHPDAFTTFYKLKTIASALLFPGKELVLPYAFETVSRDPGVRIWLDKDPHKRLGVPGSMLLQLLGLSQSTIANLKESSAPVLMVTAGIDKVVNNPTSEKLFRRLSAPRKKHVHMSDAWHDLMFDPQIDEVADEVADWLQSISKSEKVASAEG